MSVVAHIMFFVYQVPVFRSLPLGVVNAFADNLDARIYSPGDYIGLRIYFFKVFLM